MKLIVAGKNFTVGDHLTQSVESKFKKLDKYFADEIEIHVTMWVEKGRQAVEATIPAKGTMFRAEEVSEDMYVAIDMVVDKLSNQITRHKAKLQRKHKGQNVLKFDEIPDDYLDDEESLKIVKSKKFDIKPMAVEEAVLQMELIGHSFFVFINYETESVNVVYKRKDQKYGLIEPNY